jgi:hypothetical protein
VKILSGAEPPSKWLEESHVGEMFAERLHISSEMRAEWYRVTDAHRMMEKTSLHSNNGLVSFPPEEIRQEWKFTEEDEVAVCSSFVIKVSTRLSTDGMGWDLC